MPSITFDLETITPLFMAGADQATAELRPPAFRGALRYWFRAIAASVADFEEVKKWEKKVFGSTEANGAVIIRLQTQKAVSNCTLKKDNEFSGLVYLFFSTYGDSNRQPRGCFPPGSRFKLILQTRLSRENDNKCFQLAICAMWMLINFGGLGSRSNRGGGNLKVNKEPAKNNFSIKFKLETTRPEQLSSELAAGIQAIKILYRKILLGRSKNLISEPTQFDVLDSQTASLYLWQSPNMEDNDYWDSLLDSFGKKYQTFRLRYNNARQDDYKEVKDWLQSGGKTFITTVKRAAFGLPIQFRFKSLKGKQASIEATGGINRSSSPLHIRVLELSDKTVTLLIIHFQTQLLPENQRLRIRSKQINKAITLPVPNQDIIEQEFLPSLGNLTTVLIP